MDPTSGLLLALLFAGHVVGDFLLQTRRMAERKTRPGPLIVHGVRVAAAQAPLLLPFLTWRVVLVLAGVTLSRGLIDAFTARIRRRARSTRSLVVFVVDQALHVAVLFAAWSVLAPHVIGPRWIPAGAISLATGAAILIAAYIFSWNGGSAIVRGVLALVRLADDADVSAGARSARVAGTGHLIGALERFLALTLVLLGQWGALGFIIAAKSIARFKELENREFAEYYLVGTLTSIIVAMTTGLLVRTLLAGSQ